MDKSVSATDISAAGLSAQRTRMNVIAENLANLETTQTADGAPYRRKLVVFGAEAPTFGQALAAEQAPLVRVLDIVESSERPQRVQRPGHPDADANGQLTLPYVTALLEVIDLLAATRAYEANVAAFRAARSMGSKALEIGR